MFTNIFKLGTTRSALQSVGFYISYLLLLLIVCGIAGAIAGVVTDGGFNTGLRIGHLIAILACPSLGFAVLKEKGAFSFGNVLLALLAGILAALGGGLMGLIPVSYLTTKPSAPAETGVD